ncbi:hypothetical protein, partial [Cloacibacillus evryensis]
NQKILKFAICGNIVDINTKNKGSLLDNFGYYILRREKKDLNCPLYSGNSNLILFPRDCKLI